MARVAIVTGAARATGAATAVNLAESGMDIALLDADEDACAATVDRILGLGRRCMAVGADLADEASVDAAVARVGTVLGDPAVLVNIVSVVHQGPLLRSVEHDWSTVIGRHLRGAFLVSRAVIDPMAKYGWGRVITVADAADVSDAESPANLTVRDGLAGFTRTAALELGPLGLTANLVAPALPVAGLPPAPLKAVAGPGYAIRAARVVSLLVSDEAASVSGQVVYIGDAS
jgi:3-oxoacyl-[acyl-carrier protein] reductase